MLLLAKPWLATQSPMGNLNLRELWRLLSLTVMPVIIHCGACHHSLWRLSSLNVAPVITHCGACHYSLWCLLSLTVMPVITHCGACHHSLWRPSSLTVSPVITHCGACHHSLWRLSSLTVTPVITHWNLSKLYFAKYEKYWMKLRCTVQAYKNITELWTITESWKRKNWFQMTLLQICIKIRYWIHMENCG